MTHFVSKSCRGEHCGICYRQGQRRPATHKVGEEILSDWYEQHTAGPLHNLTQYVCCQHFAEIFSAKSTSEWRGCEVG